MPSPYGPKAIGWPVEEFMFCRCPAHFKYWFSLRPSPQWKWWRMSPTCIRPKLLLGRQ